MADLHLGGLVDAATGERTDGAAIIPTSDLTTHGVIVGMTGSGKTGLCVVLLEEAAIDGVPALCIDPKGDLGNLLLNFPTLAPTDFADWVDPAEAARKGLSVADYAAQTATQWKSGLADWGQPPERIARLRDAVDMAIYTPGADSGLPLSMLQSFKAPPAALASDATAFAERVAAVASGLLTLLGRDVDPLRSREHILISNLLDKAWREGRDMDLAQLIGAIQKPSIERLGALDLETFYPAKERLELALALNAILASPGFAAWTQGEPLDAQRLLFTPEGKPRIVVLSIAHLSDSERMFVVTLVLNEMIQWMRKQSGTSSLRAILYMDEIAGYFPPTANPPSKPPMLTLLKQARAFGLGCVLATQNPVDLDYRGLSNTGTWFIGRLQTERDKMRVMEGLEGVSGGQPFDKTAMEQTIAGLGKRVFLLHSVHEPAPITFETRWTLSYLAGPMTREQIKSVTAHAPSPAAVSGSTASASALSTGTTGGGLASLDAKAASAPVLPPDVPQYFLPPDTDGPLVYNPVVLGLADVSFTNAKLGVTESRRVTLMASIDDGPIALEWDSAERVELEPSALEQRGRDGAAFGAIPAVASKAKNYGVWSKSLQKWVVANETVTLYKSAAFKTTSQPGETEAQFRIRLQVMAHEARDAKIEVLRGKYAAKLTAAQDKLRRAEQAVQRESQQASQAKMDTAISVGGAILGAIFGRGKVGVGTLGKVATATRGAGRAMQQSGDVARAQETLAAEQQKYAELEAKLQAEVDALGAAYDAQQEQLEEVIVRAKSTDVQVQLCALLWVPYTKDANGLVSKAWG